VNHIQGSFEYLLAYWFTLDTSAGINVAGAHVQFSESVKLLGIQLDNELSMTVMFAVVRGCNYHIRALRHIRPRLDLNSAKMIAQGIVAARLDYCNSLMCGMSTRNLCRLQVTQNTLARAVCSAPWSTGATELHRSLHWLPVRQHIDYKTTLIAFQARRTGCPAYITSLLQDCSTMAPLSHGQIAITITFLSFDTGKQSF